MHLIDLRNDGHAGAAIVLWCLEHVRKTVEPSYYFYIFDCFTFLSLLSTTFKRILGGVDLTVEREPVHQEW